MREDNHMYRINSSGEEYFPITQGVVQQETGVWGVCIRRKKTRKKGWPDEALG